MRIAWGGVAHKPWRARVAEDALRGQTFSEDAVREAAADELSDASTGDENAYKVAMVRNATVLTLGRLAREQQEQR